MINVDSSFLSVTFGFMYYVIVIFALLKPRVCREKGENDAVKWLHRPACP